MDMRCGPLLFCAQQDGVLREHFCGRVCAAFQPYRGISDAD